MRNLFLMQGVWDEAKVDPHFLPIDSEVIKAIPMSFSLSEYRLIWHYEQNGNYLVQSVLGFNICDYVYKLCVMNYHKV